jgi:ribosomal-protein-alanine N-acetyltransferase
MEIKSRRLELVAATVESTRAEIEDRPRLARLLRASVPEGWPPPLNDEQSMRYNLEYLEKDLSRIGWAHWYLILPESGGREGADGSVGSAGPAGSGSDGRRLVGVVGLKGKPTGEGCVEVGYSVMGDQQRRGYGTEGTAALISWAFSHPEVVQVIAETLPELRPSIRVMEANGMRFLGKGSEKGVIRYGITREEFSRR